MTSQLPHGCLRLEEALGAMAGAASTGQLVPLTGAGISRPLCRGWEDFLKKLSEALHLILDLESGDPGNDALYRIADRAAFALRLLPEGTRRELIAWALREESEKAKPPGDRIPPQARALAAWYWPLVITTNYDDVFIAALGPRLGLASHEELMLHGRGPQDCEAVLRSLDSNTSRILWCIQGYVGGVVPDESLPGLSPFDEKALLDQVVIGHQQYQQAAYQSPAFRRAFAEVYRRRSLAFIGSGLAESYFVNLLSEIVVNFGPSPQPHFALFSRDEYRRHRLDGEFLRIRLGVTPVIYGDTHKDLPEALWRILPPMRRCGPDPHPVPVSRPLAVSFSVPRRRVADDPLEVSLRFRDLPQLVPEQPIPECVVLSVGLKRENGRHVPREGQQARSFLREYYHTSNTSAPGPWRWIRETERLFRLKDERGPQPVFAVAARDVESSTAVRRSLTAISEATMEALARIEEIAEFRKVFMGVLAASKKRVVHPTYSFIAQLAGIRRFADMSAPSVHRMEFVEIRIVDPRISAPVIGGRIPVRELLSSDLVRVFVRVADTAARQEGYTLDVGSDKTVREALEVLRTYNVAVGKPCIEVRPLPYPGFQPVLEAPVFPTMTIEIRPSPEVSALGDL